MHVKKFHRATHTHTQIHPSINVHTNIHVNTGMVTYTKALMHTHSCAQVSAKTEIWIFYPQPLYSFRDKVSLCSLGWPQTHRHPPMSASWVLGLKVCAITTGTTFSFKRDLFRMWRDGSVSTSTHCSSRGQSLAQHHLQLHSGDLISFFWPSNTLGMNIALTHMQTPMHIK